MPSESEATRRWLNDIGHHIDMAKGFIAGMNYEAFRDDTRTIYAVTRCLEIISEASRRLPDDLKGRHPSIEWREMAAAGNIYRHEYEDVAARRVWQTLTVSLTLLAAVIEHELQRINRPDDEDQIAWVELKFDFPDDATARLQKVAEAAGLSVKCYCLRVLLKHLLRDADAEQGKRWQKQVPATLRRNGCDDKVDL